MKNTFILIITLLGFFVFSCQPDANSSDDSEKSKTNDKIFGNLYVRYIHPDNQMKAEASFSKGTTKKNSIPIELKGGVSFQGSGLAARKILNKMIKYSTERVGNYSKEYRFGFNINDKKINIPMPMSSIDSLYPLGDASISKGLNVKIIGEKFSNDESLVALISDKTNYTTSFIVPKINTDNTIHLPTSAFSKLKTGNGQIYLVRKRTFNYQKNNYELNATTEYYSKQIPIKIRK